MPTIRDTAYPRLKGMSSPQDLRCLYTPSRRERAFARQHCVNREASACFSVLLKTFQRVGYFVAVRDVPPDIVRHIANRVRVRQDRLDRDGYDKSGSRSRHMEVIREHLGIRRMALRLS